MEVIGGLFLLVVFLVTMFSGVTGFIICAYILLVLYLLFKPEDPEKSSPVLKVFRVAIIGYSIFCIGIYPEFKLGIFICVLIAFICCPVSDVDRNKMTWDVLWEAISFGIVAGIIFVYAIFDEVNQKRVDVWIGAHYVMFMITYFMCWLLARPEITRIENKAKDNLKSQEKSDSLLPYALVIIVLSIVFVSIYRIYNEPAKVNRTSSVGNVKKEEQTQKENTDWVYLRDAQGKYGAFSTYFHKNSIKFEKNIFGTTIVDSYDKCTEKMPYCEKYKRIVFNCDAKVFFVAKELMEKNGKAVKEIVYDRKKASIKKISDSKIITNVFNETCGSYLEEQKKNAQQKKIAPTPSYTPPYNPPSYSVPPSKYKAVCRDGTYSYSRGRGTCSHHGGVAYYL